MHRRKFVGWMAASSGMAAVSLGRSSEACSPSAAAVESPGLPLQEPNPPAQEKALQEDAFDVGAFSISLTVKDLAASRAFYEKLGFKSFAGDAAQNWLILRNGNHVIGLFQGVFEKNILTFNPGWDQNAKPLKSFTDVRELQKRLKAQGVKLATEADESTSGPASFLVIDPDGNPVLFDQHV